MRRRFFSSFRSRLLAAGIAPIILMGAAAAFNAAVSATNLSRVSQLFSLDLFMEETLASVDAVVTNLAVYIDTKNSDALRAYMHHSKILSEKAGALSAGPSYSEDAIIERNLAVLTRRLIAESEAAIRAKRGRNIPEYGAKFQEVRLLASFIHDRADALSLERLKLNLDAFARLAEESGKAASLLGAMLAAAMAFATAVVASYSLKLTEPLNALAAAAVRISKGDFSGGPLSAPGDDEIAQTATAFNVMQASVEAYIDEIKNKAAVEASLMDERLKNLEMEGHLRHAELKALQSRINPHFLFNTLNAGIQLATVEDADRTRVFLERLAGLMRYSFRDIDVPVALRDELACLRDYVYLMSIRFPESIGFEIAADPAAERAAVPKLIIQPLVENCIRHGLADRPAGGLVRVSARIDADDLVITIEDNGTGITEDRATEILAAADSGTEPGSAEGGLGMANVISRLRLFAGRRDVIEFRDAGPGARLIVRVPFKEAF